MEFTVSNYLDYFCSIFSILENFWETSSLIIYCQMIIKNYSIDIKKEEGLPPNLAFLGTVEVTQVQCSIISSGEAAYQSHPCYPYCPHVLITDLLMLPSSQVQIPTFILVWIRC